ncbi:MAG TPA: BON domain-containing protein [Gammaproteobacteria bacterium]|nr:BON domain-containing protein [Gammaproteobacteria bacterium]
MLNRCLIAVGIGLAFAVPAANAQLQNPGGSVGSLTGITPVQHVQGAPSDAQVGLEVQAQLRQKVQIANFNSQIQNGVVTLRGTAHTDAERMQAEQLARQINGVARVENQIVVDAGRAAAVDNTHTDTDASLEAAVRQSLRSDPSLHSGTIDVMTRSNIVTLTGVVRTNEEKELAGRLASQTREVSEVRNRLAVSGN